MDFDRVHSQESSPQLDDETFKFEAGSKHGIKALMMMDDLRKRQQLCDVTICVGNKQLRVHRIVLSSFSCYFLTMFTGGMAESYEESITINDVDCRAVELLIDYAYTGKLDITVDTVQSLLFASSLFQVSAIQKACSDFLLRQLHPSNCLGIRSFADTHSCPGLFKASEKYIHEHFNDVVQNEEFLLLPPNELALLLTCEDLNVNSEEDVYNALIAWARENAEERQAFLAELLGKVRLPSLSPHFLVDQVEKEDLIRQDIACRNLLDEAKNFHMLPDRRSKLRGEKSRPRRSTYGSLYSVCGMDSTGHPVKTVEKYDFHSGKVKLVAPVNTPRSGVGVAVLDGKIYAVGGHDGTTYLNSVECYDIRTKQWKYVASMAHPRRYVAAAVLNGLLYAVGGYDGFSVLDSVEVYDPSLDQWKHVANMANPRRHVAVGVLDSKDSVDDSSEPGYLYAVGGHDGINYLKTVEKYNPETNEWTYVASMGARRGGVGVATVGGCLYATGGYDGASNLNTSERYYSSEDRWAFVAPMSVCRSGHGVGVVNGCVYAVGGHDGVSYRNKVEYFNPQVGEWTTVGLMGSSKAVAGVAVLKEY